MDNKNDSYFYLGGLISTLILLLVFLLFSYALFFEQESKSYALTKDNSINVSLVMDTPKKNIDKKVEKEPATVKEEQPKEIEAPVKKEDTETKEKETPIQEADVSTLFSKVFTKSSDSKKTDKKVNIDKRQLQKLTKKVDTLNKNDVASLTQKIENTKFSKASVQVTSQSSSTGAEVNKYLAKIQGQIYDNFFPPSNTQGQTGKVLIKLSSDGTVLDFRIVSYSGSDLFNTEVDRLKRRVMMLKFPQNPDGKSGNYMITLIAKE
jgi:protein TonB